MERLHESLAESFEESERPPEEKNIALDLAALGETPNRLPDNRAIDRSGDVFFPSPLVQQRLNIAFGEDAAARGNWVDLGGFERKLIQLIDRNMEKGCHLIDEGSGPVHPFFGSTGEENDFRIFAPEFDHHV